MSSVLRLDFDNTRQITEAQLARMEWVCRMLRWRIVAVALAPSRSGWHVEIVLSRRISAESLVAAQALCGSDFKRETFNLARARRLRAVPAWWRVPSRWNVLYHAHYKLT